MPVMDGNTATREIRHYEKQQHLKPTKIIALTGLASTSARIDALSSGADQFLTKPIRFQVLMPLLEESSAELERERDAEIGDAT
jgi:CheY-like chemotaxis protein